MTNKKFYIVLSCIDDGILNTESGVLENIQRFEDTLILQDNNILTDNTLISSYSEVIEFDKFGKIISEGISDDLDLDFSNITNEFKNTNELYIFDDSDINQIVLDNIEEIIEIGEIKPKYIQDTLENSVVLTFDQDYKDFYLDAINIDFEKVDIVSRCLSMEAVKSWIVNNYNVVNVNDDVMIVINA